MTSKTPALPVAQREPSRENGHTHQDGMDMSGAPTEDAATPPPVAPPLPKTGSMQPEHAGMTMPMAAGISDQGTKRASEGGIAHAAGPPWAHAIAVIILGVWLISSPTALGYGSTAMSWSDLVSGLVMITLASVTLVRRSVLAPWTNSLVGVWLLFAPLLFKAPTSAAFANDSLVGALLIAFVLLMPGMPGMRMLPGPDVPPGWSYNPSSWAQRAPTIALAFLAFFLSRQMAAYQLGYTRAVWEPFFTPGTVGVLTSTVSRSFPISDAGLGALAYMLEGLMGFMGGKDRWRTMPWMVTFFGILVVPLGIASITLIVMQPLVVGTWCTPCLLTALAMLIMIALTLDEVVAMGVFLVQARAEGQPLWRTFWLGGTLSDPTPESVEARSNSITASSTVWGVSLPWNLLGSTALGLFLMASPTLFGTAKTAASSDQLVGALVTTVAIISLAEVGRAARLVNILFGAWLIAAPWVMAGATTTSRLSDVVLGVALIVLSLPRGPVRERYGSYQRFVR